MSGLASALGSVANLSVSAIGTSAIDVIAVFDNSGNQLFSGARPVKASVKPSAKMMQHPVESGYLITDHRVINGIEITLNIILDPEDYYDTYQQIGQAYVGNNSLVVQTRTGVYYPMYIKSLPHEETPEMYDTVSIILELIEVIVVQSSTQQLSASSVANPASTPTVAKGAQQGTAATSSQEDTTKSSAAYSAAKSLGFL